MSMIPTNLGRRSDLRTNKPRKQEEPAEQPGEVVAVAVQIKEDHRQGFQLIWGECREVVGVAQEHHGGELVEHVGHHDGDRAQAEGKHEPREVSVQGFEELEQDQDDQQETRVMKEAAHEAETEEPLRGSDVVAASAGSTSVRPTYSSANMPNTMTSRYNDPASLATARGDVSVMRVGNGSGVPAVSDPMLTVNMSDFGLDSLDVALLAAQE
jgi:hypothetical protein